MSELSISGGIELPAKETVNKSKMGACFYVGWVEWSKQAETYRRCGQRSGWGPNQTGTPRPWLKICVFILSEMGVLRIAMT